ENIKESQQINHMQKHRYTDHNSGTIDIEIEDQVSQVGLEAENKSENNDRIEMELTSTVDTQEDEWNKMILERIAKRVNGVFDTTTWHNDKIFMIQMPQNLEGFLQYIEKEDKDLVGLFLVKSYEKLPEVINVLNKLFHTTILPPYLSEFQDLPKPVWEIFNNKTLNDGQCNKNLYLPRNTQLRIVSVYLLSNDTELSKNTQLKVQSWVQQARRREMHIVVIGDFNNNMKKPICKRQTLLLAEMSKNNLISSIEFHDIKEPTW
ncbi:34599_t:CDS:2, partial [Gigaspora margarita]